MSDNLLDTRQQLNLSTSLPEIIQWRRDIHQNPELGFEEHRSANIVAEKLTAFGYKVQRGIGKTGVVGTLSVGSSSRSIGLRADMDALPIQEANDLSYRSTRPNVMHACGHDGHTAMLLGAARHLAETRRFNGTVQLIFQPAEEGLGGAAAMIADGLFERFPMGSVYGMHNWPGMPVGHFGVCHGAMMASSDTFDITLTGKGGHAALPHESADPIVAASQLVMQLQTLISRNIKPIDAAVLSVTQIKAGSAYNVIPEQATIRGGVRTLNPMTQTLVETRIREVMDGVCTAAGVSGKLEYKKVIPVLLNTEQEVNSSIAAANEVSGQHRVCSSIEPTMGAEDFAYMLQKKPGCYIFTGNGGNGNGAPCMLHNPGYDFNDDAIEWGVRYWCRLVETILSCNNPQS